MVIYSVVIYRCGSRLQSDWLFSSECWRGREKLVGLGLLQIRSYSGSLGLRQSPWSPPVSLVSASLPGLHQSPCMVSASLPGLIHALQSPGLRQSPWPPPWSPWSLPVSLVSAMQSPWSPTVSLVSAGLPGLHPSLPGSAASLPGLCQSLPVSLVSAMHAVSLVSASLPGLRQSHWFPPVSLV